jgi:hypothetical protein
MKFCFCHKCGTVICEQNPLNPIWNQGLHLRDFHGGTDGGTIEEWFTELKIQIPDDNAVPTQEGAVVPGQ